MDALDFSISVTPSMCQKERRHAFGWDNKPKDGVFVPDCESDGSYNPVQCLRTEGPCWCVDENGKEVPGTRNENGKPADCPGKETIYCVFNGFIETIIELSVWMGDIVIHTYIIRSTLVF